MSIVFYQKDATVYAVHYNTSENPLDVSKLEWLFGGAKRMKEEALAGYFIGPRREMITPWSTNAVEITQNMGVSGILRIEEFTQTDNEKTPFDPMLKAFYKGLDQYTFTIDKKPDPVVYIENIWEYNQQEGLALNDDEIAYLEGLAKKLGRPLTDSEVFGFSQVNSEHCRHKIFNGTFIIDGEEKESTLFKLIKKTSQENPNRIVSAYKDNCAFIEGPQAVQFAPNTQDKPDFYETKDGRNFDRRRIAAVRSSSGGTGSRPYCRRTGSFADSGHCGLYDLLSAFGCFPLVGTENRSPEVVVSDAGRYFD